MSNKRDGASRARMIIDQAEKVGGIEELLRRLDWYVIRFRPKVGLRRFEPFEGACRPSDMKEEEFQRWLGAVLSFDIAFAECIEVLSGPLDMVPDEKVKTVLGMT